MPLMSDPRFAPDTLFLVAEEDWRLWKDDCKKGEKLRPADLPEDRQAELSAPTGSQDAYPAVKAFNDPTASSSQPTTGEGELRSWGRGTKAAAAGVQQISQELLDILHMCNAAHRQGRGDVVWLSYNVNGKQSWCPSYGSTLVAVSARGARLMHDNWSAWFKSPMHFDIALREVLMELSAELSASFLRVPLGGWLRRARLCLHEHQEDAGQGVPLGHAQSHPRGNARARPARTSFQPFAALAEVQAEGVPDGTKVAAQVRGHTPRRDPHTPARQAGRVVDGSRHDQAQLLRRAAPPGRHATASLRGQRNC